MNTLKCSIVGCKEVFTSELKIAPDARYICRHHPRAEQILAVGRTPTWHDELDKEEHFQLYAFDKDIRRRGKGADVDGGGHDHEGN